MVAVLSCATRGSYVTVTGFAQGGTYTVKFNAEGLKESPEQVRDSIDALLRDIDNSLSGYNKKSLLSRFNAGETIYPDAIFIDMYTRAYDVFDQTGGVVDAALWRQPLFTDCHIRTFARSPTANRACQTTPNRVKCIDTKTIPVGLENRRG